MFGCRVSIVEAENTLLPALPNEVGNTIEKYMRMDGIDVMTNSVVDGITRTGAVINGKEIEASKLLICIGRRPNIIENELNDIGVVFNQSGIVVNDKMQTNVSNIYAIGDVTGMYELAHVASKQGEVAAENIMGIGQQDGLPHSTHMRVYISGDCIRRSAEWQKYWSISTLSKCKGKLLGRIARICSSIR